MRSQCYNLFQAATMADPAKFWSSDVGFTVSLAYHGGLALCLHGKWKNVSFVYCISINDLTN